MHGEYGSFCAESALIKLQVIRLSLCSQASPGLKLLSFPRHDSMYLADSVTATGEISVV